MKIALICLAFVDFLVFSVFFFLHGEKKELFYNDSALDEMGDDSGVIFFLTPRVAFMIRLVPARRNASIFRQLREVWACGKMFIIE